MDERPIRVGIVGAGANTRNMHIPNLQALEGVEIVSVCNRSLESSKRAADQFGIPKIYDHWWELVAADDCDAIVIGTWPNLHCQATLAALNADKHVMVEARMAMNADEAEQMARAARAKPYLVTQVVPAPLSFGVDSTMQRLLAEGYLGTPLVVEVHDHSDSFLDMDSPLHWRQNVALSGVNMLTVGIWYETLMRWLGEANSVVAMGKSFVKMRMNNSSGHLAPTPLPEHLTVCADMNCGAQATFSFSRVTGLRPLQEVILYGSDGTLRFDGQKLYGGRRGEPELRVIDIPDAEQGFWRVEEEFIGAIRGLEPIRYTTFPTGLKYMRFSESVANSLRTGETVRV